MTRFRTTTTHRCFRALLLLGALLILALLSASTASAAYQQVGNFAGNPGELHNPNGLNPEQYAALWPEKVQLGGLGGMAVNYTGAGGVPAGTIYAATYEDNIGGVMIARYNPDGSFSEAWRVLGDERCGPDGEPAHPHCVARPEKGQEPIDVDVDQTTGNVYALGALSSVEAGATEIEVFSADGSEVITSFGERAASGETTAASPGKIHSSKAGGIAVNAAGEVYVYDENAPADNFYHRLMVFKPKVPGNYTEYEYAGQDHDIAAGFFGETKFPAQPATDAAGDVYTAVEGGEVSKYEPGKPAGPVCFFNFNKGGITAMTVNPKTGEVFFYTYVDHKVHRLNPCDAEGKFSEAEAFKIAPPRQRLGGMAVDPERSFGPGRAAGVLYLGAPYREGGETKGTFPDIEVESSMGYIFAPPKELAPSIVSESVSAVASSSARLEAKINPEGTPSRYTFQYLTEAAYLANEPEERFAGAAEVPLGGSLLEGSATLPVAAAIAGLGPDATYRFRVIATSLCSSTEPEKVCEAAGAAKSFTTYPLSSPGLPDDRADELVSPAQKNGGQVFPADPLTGSCGNIECKPGVALQHFPMQSAPDGQAVVFEGNPFSPSEGAVIENSYLAQRDPTSGWQTRNLTPPLLESKGGQGYKDFSTDLATGVLEATRPSLSPAAPTDFSNLYRQPTADPLELQPLILEEPPHRLSGTGAGALVLRYAGASSDLSRVFFEANDELLPGALGGEGEETDLYESSAGELHQVNLAPGGEPLPGARFGSGAFNSDYVISTDGTRAFWTSAAGRLFVRIDGTQTQAVSASQRESPDPLGTRASRFLTSSSDGSRVLFASAEELTNESHTGLKQNLTINASGGSYVLTFKGESTAPLPFNSSATTVSSALEGLGAIGSGDVVVDGAPAKYSVTFVATLATNREAISADGSGLIGGTVTIDEEPAGENLYEWHQGVLTDLTPDSGGAFQGLVGQSENLSHIYFVDTAILSEEENGVGEKAATSKPNLYAFIDGTTTYLATLLEKDNENGVGDWAASPLRRTAEASPDGRWLSFLSKAPLTGYDNTGPCERIGETNETLDAPCAEVFLYDSATDELRCPSCNPSGSLPLGPSVLRVNASVGGAPPQPRYLLDSGRLYFDSSDSLVPTDTNHGIEDVYQYEPQGVGGCKREGGCVSLISGGREFADSNFLATDSSGDNVFFTTRDRLVAADTDELYDLYDARVGGGFAFESESPPLPCQGEGCQPPPAPQPELPLPTQTLTGPGNLKPAKGCKKGKVKQHGKCVKKHKAKKHHKRASHNAGGHR